MKLLGGLLKVIEIMMHIAKPKKRKVMSQNHFEETRLKNRASMKKYFIESILARTKFIPIFRSIVNSFSQIIRPIAIKLEKIQFLYLQRRTLKDTKKLKVGLETSKQNKNSFKNSAPKLLKITRNSRKKSACCNLNSNLS